jgi:hypothetical protein
LIVIGAAIYGGVILITGAAKLSDLRGLRRRSTTST